MTLLDILRTISEADSLFQRAAKAWERGNNSGDSAYLSRMEKQCDACRARAEEKLAPFAIEIDYPGLYPSFKVDGYAYNTTESAVSAAVRVSMAPRTWSRTAPAIPHALPDSKGPGWCEDDMGCNYQAGVDELRVLPIGSMGNLILSRDGFSKHQNAELARGAKGKDITMWSELAVYNPA
jgi:hypothetical protein